MLEEGADKGKKVDESRYWLGRWGWYDVWGRDEPVDDCKIMSGAASLGSVSTSNGCKPNVVKLDAGCVPLKSAISGVD